jgi:hypothetical protein
MAEAIFIARESSGSSMNRVRTISAHGLNAGAEPCKTSSGSGKRFAMESAFEQIGLVTNEARLSTPWDQGRNLKIHPTQNQRTTIINWWGKRSR